MSTKSQMFLLENAPKFPSLKGVWRFHFGPLPSTVLQQDTRPNVTIRETDEGLKMFPIGGDGIILPLTKYSEFIPTTQGGALRITNPDWVTIAGIRDCCKAQELHKGEFWLLIFG